MAKSKPLCFRCPLQGWDSGTETEQGTPEVDATEDGEGGGPTMGPKFRAAEQSLQTEFQIFPVSLERPGQEMAVDTFLFLTVFCVNSHTLAQLQLQNVYQALAV